MKNPVNSDTCTNLIRYFQMQRDMEMHQKRIRNVQPTLRAPRDFTNRSAGHIKKQPLAQFNRIVTIDIENKALLKKLTDKSPSRIGKDKPYKIVKNNRKKNLEDFKQRQQNEGLLKRIKQAKSSYQNGRFASQRKITQSYINTISKYGYKNLAPNKTIMLPFNKRNLLRLFKPGTAPENSFYKTRSKDAQVMSHENSILPESDPVQKDTVLSIQTMQLSGESTEKRTRVTYIKWTHKVTIQIDTEGEDSLILQMNSALFKQNFDQRIRNVHRAIKWDPETCSYFIDLEQG